MENINWSLAEWSYLLGVVHGDGSVAPRSVEIHVGYKDAVYANQIIQLWQQLGYDPKLYRPRSALKIGVHRSSLAQTFRVFKSKGLWKLPEDLQKSEWLAGVFDTDGCVSIAAKKCAVILTLKRSGNLELVADALESLGITRPTIHNRISKFQGKDYLVEELRLTSFTNIKKFNEFVHLRHPKKSQRLADIMDHIRVTESTVPLWKLIADFCKEPRTWKEIATKFKLTKAQVDSALQKIKREMEVEIIPPPEALTHYRVKDPFFSQGR